MRRDLPKSIILSEVSPRDGLQMETKILSTEEKLSLISALAASGIQRIEVTGFVHPRAVPQMADARQVAALLPRDTGVRFGAFVPNAKGAEIAIEAGIDDIKCGIAASDSFNEINVRMDRDTATRTLHAMGALDRPAGCELVGTIGTAFGCPYEGEVPVERLRECLDVLGTIGCRIVHLADTTGMANPDAIWKTLDYLGRYAGDVAIGLHLHNTRGAGIANALAGLMTGVTHFESSAGGLGGCPFAPRAVGNICSEDFVHMVEGMGIDSGIDLDRLIDAALLAEQLVERPLPGMVMKSGKASTRFSVETRQPK
ncbi:MAG: hydroxymethylglutaryl-CoA lyase [Bauldia litoralis]